MLSGTEENLAEFKTQMPRPLADKVVGQINLDVERVAGRGVGARLRGGAGQRSSKRKQDLLEQVITLAHKGGAGALGLADTLAALQQGRVHQLLVDPALRQAGRPVRATAARWWSRACEACPYCGGKLTPSSDVVNLAVHRGDGRGRQGVGAGAEPRLAEVGQIAAVLRY